MLLAFNKNAVGRDRYPIFFFVILQSKSFAPLRIKGLVDSVSLELAVAQLNQAERVAFPCKYERHFAIQETRIRTSISQSFVKLLLRSVAGRSLALTTLT